MQYYMQQPQQSNLNIQQRQQQQVNLNNIKLNQQQGSNPNLNLNINPNQINLVGSNNVNSSNSNANSSQSALNVLNNGLNPQLLQQQQNQARLVAQQQSQTRGQQQQLLPTAGVYNPQPSGYNPMGNMLTGNDISGASIGVPAGLVNHGSGNAVGTAAINAGSNSTSINATSININTLLQQQQQQQAQQQVQQQQLMGTNTQSVISEPDLIKEVWNYNMHEEFGVIRKLVKKFKFISLSTEIPGIIARPIGKFTNVNDYHYQTMRVNSDITNMIQLSITLSDSNGKKPTNYNASLSSTWQFNFKFDLKDEMFGSESINDLRMTGVNFEKFDKFGIEHNEFAELLIDSGLILGSDSDITWISFNCGYDFGFLSSLLINNLMPNESEDFLWWCHKFYHKFYDIKYISLHQSNLFPNNGSPSNNTNSHTANTNHISGFNGSNILSGSNNNNGNNASTSSGEVNFKRFNLENLADNLGIPVQQSSYLQSGNQSLLTSICFFELRRLISLSSGNANKDGDGLETFKNLVWGIDKNNEMLLNNAAVNLGSNVNNNGGGISSFNMAAAIAAAVENNTGGGNVNNNTNMGMGTPLQHAINMGMNVGSPMYLSR
ncbi:CCR4-NOT core DEDD family RNase subunit [Saccharomycopsis crataegensis]|uniref:poly(A)-specific ribonuclease n=1 Tax=Saccharomycopsis crataegensis TaxID=43959 RepID=A0AAV5QHX5_9ASCO|nr:CCR4-NOT core DEDD family RNase subunit [Saccharomycopsis crataegensis]